MIEWINSNISLETLIWLFPITFLLHDFEEIIFVEAWFQKNYSKVETKIPTKMKKTFHELSQMNAARFSIPVFMQFVIYIIASYLAVEKDFYGPFIAFNILFFLHIFGHLGQTIFLKTYALGVGSAFLITFPYSIYLFYRLLSEDIIRVSDMILSLPYGLILVFVFWLGHEIAPKILRNK